MPVVSSRIMPEGIVRFRINSFDPNPLPAPMSRPGEFLLSVHLDMPETKAHINCPLLPQEFQPYREAIADAVRSQDLYWVDNTPDPNWSPGFPMETPFTRILKALANHQLVEDE